MKHLIIGSAGHIDHGKTSLIRMLTGIDCDTHKEEKQRGITINLGFSYLNLPNGESYGIIDVPGHKDFINTMIGGACGIDMVLLVIAADSGIMPQTTDHVNIISSLGIRKGVVALTKADLVDEELLELATLEVVDYLSDTTLADAPVIAVSATTGAGKEALIEAISQVSETVMPRANSKLFRMYIDRIFTVPGFGSVVTGSVMGGKIAVGEEVFLLPGYKQKLRLRSIERHGQQVESVVAGDRAAINLIGLKREDFERGMLLCDKQIEATEMVDAVVKLFEAELQLKVWSNVAFISGTFECQARMHLLNKDELTGGEEAIVQLHLNKKAILLPKDKFIVRNSSGDKTLGGGMVIEAAPLHHRRRTAKLVASIEQYAATINSDNSLEAMLVALVKKEFRPFTVDELASKLNLSSSELLESESFSNPELRVYGEGVDSLFVSAHFDGVVRTKILAMLSAHHKQFPMSVDGLDTAAITGKLGAGKQYPGFVLAKMEAEGLLSRSGNTWILHGHKPSFDKKSLDDIKWLEEQVLNYGENKAVLAEIETKALQRNINKQRLKSYFGLLSAEGKVRFYQTDVVHSQILRKYLGILLKNLSAEPQGIELMAFKDLLGTKRLRALIIQIAEADGLIRMQAGEGIETRLFITPKGMASTV